MKRSWARIVVGIAAIGIVIAAYVALTVYRGSRSNSPESLGRWFGDRSNRPALITYRDKCPDAPFILPSDGFIGLLYRDTSGPYSILQRHTGIDIFGDGRPGELPVYAAYDGLLTRLDDWRSTVIIQHDDPLVEGRKIWTYYTHMASADGSESFVAEDFPPGTFAKPIKQGTLLGFQGDWAGDVAYRVGLHVHFSIVTSEDNGSFKNEAVLANTLDPSPYLGMNVKIDDLPARPIQCW